jgi:pimeloyl-ACP methyl ester carboxylesterase
VSASVDTAALIPGARVEVIEEAGHFSWLERPGVVRAAVEAMLQGAGQPG